MKSVRIKTTEYCGLRIFPSTSLRRIGLLRRFTSSSNFESRSAIASIDLIVSMVLLVSVLSTATALCFRINQIWKNISHQRLATNELANQMDWLTRLDPKQASSAIQTLQASELCSRSLRDPKLSGQISDDDLGARVSLRLSWEANPKPMQAELSGWLIDPKTERTGNSSNPVDEAAEPDPSSESDADQPDASGSIPDSSKEEEL